MFLVGFVDNTNISTSGGTEPATSRVSEVPPLCTLQAGPRAACDLDPGRSGAIRVNYE